MLRLSLPPDALEEFLSILRPTLFTPSSSPFRPRRHGSTSHPPPTFLYVYLLLSYNPSFFTQTPPSSLDTEDSDPTRKKTETPSPAIAEGDQFIPNTRSWRIPGILGAYLESQFPYHVTSNIYVAESPVSRTLTRNPFQRHPSYEVAISTVLSSHVSPALLPLPPSPPANAQVSDTLEKDEVNA